MELIKPIYSSIYYTLMKSDPKILYQQLSPLKALSSGISLRETDAASEGKRDTEDYGDKPSDILCLYTWK